VRSFSERVTCSAHAGGSSRLHVLSLGPTRHPVPGVLLVDSRAASNTPQEREVESASGPAGGSPSGWCGAPERAGHHDHPRGCATAPSSPGRAAVRYASPRRRLSPMGAGRADSRRRRRATHGTRMRRTCRYGDGTHSGCDLRPLSPIRTLAVAGCYLSVSISDSCENSPFPCQIRVTVLSVIEILKVTSCVLDSVGSATRTPSFQDVMRYACPVESERV
jgi:hypothetical protein